MAEQVLFYFIIFKLQVSINYVIPVHVIFYPYFVSKKKEASTLHGSCGHVNSGSSRNRNHTRNHVTTSY